ncbi:MAG TPA: Sir2 family NAD-dependent protein deacetylase [Acidimicrobiales bacterium]|jgi:NAD-dependent deacetylase|nr:Sir2 family NAD-dependent protein deacetylase [Acidimicrobiales bacterium]
MAGDDWDEPDPRALEEATAMVAAARAIAVLTGAGISTEAGIPDFRGPQGVWTRNPGAERLSTLDHYLEDADVRRRAWQARLVSPVWEARPTRGHAALVDLERGGKVHTIVTQNTDGLHQAAGSSPGLVVEVHGTTHWVACWSCGERTPTLTVLNRVRAGEDDPRCLAPGCGGILKTATVSFGQSLDPADVERAFLAAAGADLLLAVGTTLEVQPVAGMVPIAVRSGHSVVIVNGSPTALDPLADVVARGDIGEVLPMIVGTATG